MKLELKHLAPYLPYELKMTTNATGKTAYITNIKRRLKKIEILAPELIETMLFLRRKPILRPLSDLTKEIEHNGKKFIPIEYFIDSENPHLKDEIIETLTLDKEPYYINYGYATKLMEWHFDVFGLIEKGLAIDINTLK